MSFNETVIKRKSVRKYDMTPLSDDVLKEISEHIDQLNTPFKSKVDIKIINEEDFKKIAKGMFVCSAPHYIMFFGDAEDDDVLKKIGFLGELIVLELAEKNIGTCWLGGAKSKEKFNDSEYIISISFGNTSEAFRTNESDAKRKPLKEIAENYNKEQEEILRYVRLAPSARNLQPWFFECEDNTIDIFRTKTLTSHLSTFALLQKIDIGIAISHFTPIPFTIERRSKEKKGMQYECTLVFPK